MKINLNFRDSTITNIDKSTYKIVFDLSNMNKPRIAPETRMYIEDLNLPEFIDESYGDKGYLRGYFELRMNNIGDNDYDSEEGSSGNTIIYTSPLQSLQKFVNNDPMYISNFKVHQNFLDKLVLTLKIYDQYGNPFVTSENLQYDIDKDNQDYIDYRDETILLQNLNVEKKINLLTYDTLESKLDTQTTLFAWANNKFKKTYKNLFAKIDETIIKSSTVRAKIRGEFMKILLASNDINTISHFFEVYLLNYKMTQNPYSSVKTEMREFYKDWVTMIEYYYSKEQISKHLNELDSNEKDIFYELNSSFDPNTSLVKASKKSGVAYTVTVASPGPNKEGVVDIEYFNSGDGKTFGQNTNRFIIDKITPKDTSDDQKLSEGDQLEIDATNFEGNIPLEFTYNFSKETKDAPSNFTITNSTGNVSSSNRKISFTVTRDSLRDYSVDINDDILSENFGAGDVITILGSHLGGKDTDNDLTFSIDAIIPLVLKQNYTITNYTDDQFPSNGKLNLVVERDNTTKRYNFVGDPDYSNTKDFAVGNQITISGTNFEGEDGTNDVILEVIETKPEAYSYIKDNHDSVQERTIPITIDENNSKLYDASNVEKNPTDFSIQVTSNDKIYQVTLGAGSTSTNFVATDTLKILGSILKGKDGIHDLELTPVVDAATGVITDFTVKSGDAPVSDFALEVITKINALGYEVKMDVTKNNFVTGNTIKLEGYEFGGTNGVHDMTITIIDATSDPVEFTVSGLNPHLGSIGEIVDADIYGTAIQKTRDRAIDTKTITSGNKSVDTASLTSSEKCIIELTKKQAKGLRKIDAEVKTKFGEVLTAKSKLKTGTTKYFTTIGDAQRERLKAMNMKIVLYDELPEYKQSSGDAIDGNTYSRQKNCQYRRI